MTKDELRALYRQIRLRMSQAEVSSQSRIICRRLLNEIDWDNFESICIFEPIKKLNEVNVSAVSLRLKARQKKLHVLGSDKKAGLPIEKYGLIIVPCLAFDEDKNRLGWGGGFYDTFLAAQPQALKIGVGFSSGYIDHLPCEPHDIPLDKIITETKSY